MLTWEIRDESGRVLYSRAFASIYGEWESTAEAKTLARAFHESVRFPVPPGPARIGAATELTSTPGALA